MDPAIEHIRVCRACGSRFAARQRTVLLTTSVLAGSTLLVLGAVAIAHPMGLMALALGVLVLVGGGGWAVRKSTSCTECQSTDTVGSRIHEHRLSGAA